LEVLYLSMVHNCTAVSCIRMCALPLYRLTRKMLRGDTDFQKLNHTASKYGDWVG
jgi:hypothetical protein